MDAGSFDVWFTYLSPLRGGHVTIDDTYGYTPPSGEGFTERAVAAGDPHEALNVPSFVSLKVN